MPKYLKNWSQIGSQSPKNEIDPEPPEASQHHEEALVALDDAARGDRRQSAARRLAAGFRARYDRAEMSQATHTRAWCHA